VNPLTFALVLLASLGVWAAVVWGLLRALGTT
jgi:hypothetical protein